MALGGVKAYYQIAFASDRDKTFRQSIQFWGLYVESSPKHPPSFQRQKVVSLTNLLSCLINSLQLNVGIIAACAPTLKPVLGKVLRLPTYGRSYGNYNDISRTGGRAAQNTNRSDRLGQRSRNRASKVVDAEFEMMQPPSSFSKKNDTYRTSIKGGKDLVHVSTSRSVYHQSAGDDRSESEEYILQGTTRERKDGIVMTTEITITN